MRLISIPCSFVLVLLVCGSAFAQGKTKPPLRITPEREAAVLTFVKQYHPALGDLLVPLKGSNSKEYDKAMRELYKTSERLAQIQERDEDQYTLELKLWQAQSRAQLISARLKSTDSKDLREQLRAALNEQLDMKLALLKRERDKLQERLSDIDSQLEKMEEGRKQSVDRQLESVGSGKGAGSAPAGS